MPGPRLTRWAWWILVLLPRVMSPTFIIALTFMSSWQVSAIVEHRMIVLNLVVLIMSIGAMAVNLRGMIDSWLTWTWRGELRPKRKAG